MIQLIGAELLKLRTTRAVSGLLIATVAFTAAITAVSILTAGMDQTFSLETREGIRSVVGAPGWSLSIFVLLLGILGMAGEYRHNTITQTFLATPDRARVVAAKLVTHALAGLAFAVFAVTAGLSLALPWLALKGVDVSAADDIAPVVAGLLMVSPLYAVLGVAVGALLRNQVAAVIVALAWGQIVEGVFVGLLPEVGKWLPGGGAQALGSVPNPGGDLLPAWGGGLLFAAYALVLVLIGARVVVRRDVT